MMRTLSCFGLATVVLVLSGCGENPAANVPPAITAAPTTSVGPDPAKKVLENTPPASTTPTTAPTTTATPAPATTTPAPTAAAPTTASATALPISAETGSKIDFIGSKKVGGSHNGGFKAWTGTVDLSADKKTVSKISVDIDANSIWSDDEKLTGHLKNQDFFEVTKYPKSSFVTSEIKAGGDKGATHTLVGNLTLHGVTKSITIPATVKVTDGAVTIASEFSIKKSEFGMTFTGPGGVIRDEVVIKLDVKSAPKKG